MSSESPLRINTTAEGCSLGVRVHPGARTNAITGTHDGALKVSLTKPPTDGRANDALIAFLADRLSLPKARVQLITGASSRNKVLRIQGLTATEVETALLSSLA